MSYVLSRLLIVIFFLLLQRAVAADEKPDDPARLKVSGYGLLGNIELRNLLKSLNENGKHPEYYEANFIEDSALILISRVNRDGYLKPTIKVHLTFEDCSTKTYQWQGTIDQPLPRPTRAKEVEFEIVRGVFYYYDTLAFTGLKSETEDDAKAFFVERGALVKLRRGRTFTQSGLNRGMASLTEVLQRKGFDEAEASVAQIHQDDETGAVNVTIAVKEGPKFEVRSIRKEITYAEKPTEITTIATNAIYSRLWQQDFAQALRTTNFIKGYPDTTVEITPTNRVPTNNLVLLDLSAQVDSGEQIKMGAIKFSGAKKTRESMLRRRVRLHRRDVLNRVDVDEGRFRLTRLGIFDSVSVKYDQVDKHTRDVIYELKEGKEVDISMLFGFGSYELLRVGFEVNQYNVFGRAHHARLRLMQSFKASSADYLYTMPELIGEDVDVFFNAFGLRREEISFTREEYGASAGAHRFFKSISSDVGLRYNYQILNASKTKLADEVGVAHALVGSVTFDLNHDKRDNALYPRQGYRVNGSLETASDYLGGNVNFERLEMAVAYHQPISKISWLHFGLSQGVVFTQGNPTDELPFNKRFFPGGANSIRGYQEGEAAPRNSHGDVIGAETYTLLNVEFEQALTEKWSAVLFSDSIGFAESASNYPFDETLFSIGVGARWRTVIGPVRLEYGYNLNPRPDDPVGTLQFSIGFPF